jgi:hypothetical protein
MMRVTILFVIIVIFLLYQSYNYVEGFRLPLNTRYSCNNFCGPKGRCIKTGEQCLADIDCYGCENINKRNNEEKEEIEEKEENMEINGGTLVSPIEVSKLTTDIGTQSYIYNKDAKTPQMFLGIDKWTKTFNYGLTLEDDKLTMQYSSAPEAYRFLPTYPVSETVTGLFYDTGPSASNIYL